ncbi:flavin reductase family protein [Nostoc sp.]|uniref:flavin reductase family protein n=1 Tax=Nostoc sp. TaxID=1180 RepID=UPI002FFCDAC7
MLSFVSQEMKDPAPYHLLTSIVAPGPIAWVSTVSASGIPNLAPYSFFNAVAGFPPTIMFSVAYHRREPKEKDTLRNIHEVDEFVCHVVDEALSHAMVQTGTEFPYRVNEFDKANLKAIPATDVRPLRIESSPVAMECKGMGLITTISGCTL